MKHIIFATGVFCGTLALMIAGVMHHGSVVAFYFPEYFSLEVVLGLLTVAAACIGFHEAVSVSETMFTIEG